MIYRSRAITLTLSNSRPYPYTVKVILSSNTINVEHFFQTYVPQGYIRPALNLHSRNFTTAMQDPDGTAAFCYHHDIMTNVSFYYPKLEKNIGPAARMNWMLEMNEISFAEDSLDCMTTKCKNCVIIVLCTKSYIGYCNYLRLSLV